MVAGDNKFKGCTCFVGFVHTTSTLHNSRISDFFTSTEALICLVSGLDHSETRENAVFLRVSTSQPAYHPFCKPVWFRSLRRKTIVHSKKQNYRYFIDMGEKQEIEGYVPGDKLDLTPAQRASKDFFDDWKEPPVVSCEEQGQHSKLHGWEHYIALGSPKFICAPMVDGSELPFRMLTRKYGAQLCYSPMINAGFFARDYNYRSLILSTTAKDRPLVVQIAGHDAQTMLRSARMVENHCDAVDINLGCPQGIARRGRYGAFLQDEWDLIAEIVSTLHQGLKVPVWCKIRVFPEISKTIEYAKMIEKAGCSVLAVHGRTRDQKGRDSPPASLEHIRAVREALSIPVLANGNVNILQDAYEVLEATGCAGILAAIALLDDPSLFANPTGRADRFHLCREYLWFAEQYPVPIRIVRAHIFRMLRHILEANNDFYHKVAKTKNLREMTDVLNMLEERCRADGNDYTLGYYARKRLLIAAQQ